MLYLLFVWGFLLRGNVFKHGLTYNALAIRKRMLCWAIDFVNDTWDL